MKRLLQTGLAVCFVLCAETAWGRLRTLGTIKAVGLTSESALRVGIVLEGCEWAGVLSVDGGRTWRIADQAELPETLGELPIQGQMRYQIVENKLLLRSDNAGGTWSDASPWRFLSQAIQSDVEAEKSRFLTQYRHRLPRDELWPVAFSATAVVLLGIGGWRSGKVRRRWVAPVTLSSAVYVLTGLGLFAVHGWFTWWLCIEQWDYRLGHWDGGVNFPQWPLGVLLHLTGNQWIAPVTAAALFPITPLWACIAADTARSNRMRYLTFATSLPAVCLVALLSLAWIRGIGRGWTYGIPASADGQPGTSATGSHPIRSETNSTSSAAGSRR